MIKGFYYNSHNSKNWGVGIIKEKNSPLECSFVEYFPSEDYTVVTHLTETEYEMERALLKGEAQ